MKDIIESNTYNFLNYQTLDYINSKDYNQPYTNNNQDMTYINTLYDYNLRNQANNVSCDHQTILNKFNDININNNYISNIRYINDMKPTDYDYEKDLYMLLGRQVTPKSCDTKKKDYNNGNWINYHSDNIKKNMDNSIFNISTKNKLK
jgi:hypothetical protein